MPPQQRACLGASQGADAQLVDCDIASASGSGVGAEGGATALLRCRVHDCKRHGLAVFSNVLGSSETGAPMQYQRRLSPYADALRASLAQEAQATGVAASMQAKPMLIRWDASDGSATHDWCITRTHLMGSGDAR